MKNFYVTTSVIFLNTALLLVLGHYVLGVSFISGLIDSTGENRGRFIERIDTPVYDDIDNKEAFWEDHALQKGVTHVPYYHWRRRSFSTETVNVDSSGHRVTVKDPLYDSKKVFMFGGSTMWGTGVHDEFTIASLLQKKLGVSYDVYNLGETAYVAAQELNYLLELLTKGERPDIVIFYDGINDGFAGVYSPGIPRDPQGVRLEYEQWQYERNRSFLRYIYEKSNYRRLVERLAGATKAERRSKWDSLVAPRIEENSRRVVLYYEEHIRQVKALAREYDFEAFFFWQPYLLYGTRSEMWPYERGILERKSEVFLASQAAVYHAAKDQFSDREDEMIFFVANIFDEIEKPIYIDHAHVGPEGNRIVAEVMYEKIAPSLLQ